MQKRNRPGEGLDVSQVIVCLLPGLELEPSLLALCSVHHVPHFWMPVVLVAAEEGRISVRDFRINSQAGNVQNESPEIPKLPPVKHKMIPGGAWIL